MQDMMDDLRAALDQMNRSLSEISTESKRQTELLEKIVKQQNTNQRASE